MNLAIAIALAAESFKNKVDKAGEPYILHCLRVMNNLHTRDKELQCIAILHDTVEDEVCTLKQLHDLGFPYRVHVAVNFLTHDPKDDYMTYIKMLSVNQDARLVKLADLKDNSDITRLKGLTKKDFDRMEKYHTAYTYLSKI
jgi:(p)ppGpp synthase/HD superfamily hydrolase